MFRCDLPRRSKVLKDERKLDLLGSSPAYFALLGNLTDVGRFGLANIDLLLWQATFRYISISGPSQAFSGIGQLLICNWPYAMWLSP